MSEVHTVILEPRATAVDCAARLSRPFAQCYLGMLMTLKGTCTIHRQRIKTTLADHMCFNLLTF